MTLCIWSKDTHPETKQLVRLGAIVTECRSESPSSFTRSSNRSLGERLGLVGHSTCSRCRTVGIVKVGQPLLFLGQKRLRHTSIQLQVSTWVAIPPRYLQRYSIVASCWMNLTPPQRAVLLGFLLPCSYWENWSSSDRTAFRIETGFHTAS